MSMILPNGILFHHIPRTGGTYVREMYQRAKLDYLLAGRKHAPLWGYRRKHALRIKLIFTIIRHPCRWYESTWRWLRHTGSIGRRWFDGREWHPHYAAAKLYHPEFRKWVERVLTEEPGYATRTYESFTGAHGREMCFFIARTSTLTQDMQTLLGAMGINAGDFEVPPANTLPRHITWEGSDLWQQVLDAERVIVDRFFTGWEKERRWYVEGTQDLAAKLADARRVPADYAGSPCR